MKAVDLCCFSSAVVILATKMWISPMKQSNLSMILVNSDYMVLTGLFI